MISVASVAPETLPPDAERVLDDFAELIGLAVANTEAHAVLVEQAATDPLTRLANHRAFHERLREELSRAQRHDRPLTLALLDVDHFKTINDSLGHERGDVVLAAVAATLSDVARSEDVLARLGGDEFAILMPETSEEQALAAVERARSAIAAIELGTGLRVTVSAGICGLEHAGDPDALVRLADGALYWGKAHGRDAAWVYDPAVVRELSISERADQLQRTQALVGIRALARAIDAKDQSTREHSQRVATLACEIARRLQWSDDRVALLEDAALVHDVGKIGIADAVLLKPGRLTEDEYDLIKTHAELGAQMVDDLLLPEQVAWIRAHHERPDGRGYPAGLTEAAIPDGAAILAVADAFDVMTATRIYSAARTREDALAECRRLVGAQFSPAAGRRAGGAVRGPSRSQRLPGDPQALRAQRRGDDAGGEAPPVELGLGDEPLRRRERLGGLEQAQDRVGEAHVLDRAPDPAILDEEGAVARGPGHQGGLLVHGVDVPQARHVEAALDRGHQLGLVGRAAAGEHEVDRRRPVGRPAGGQRVARGRGARARGRARVVDDRVGDAVLDEGQRALGHALGVDRARQRAREARRVGQVDVRRRHPLAQAPDQRAAALGVGHAVEGQAAEEVQQRADGVVLEHDRVLARREVHRLLA